MYDVAIIGAGPAGVSAALYTIRANLSTLVFTHGQSELLNASKIENYYGIKSITGEHLYNVGIEQIKSFGVHPVDEEVTGLLGDGTAYEVETGGKSYPCRSLILAAGRRRRKPKIKGIADLEGHGVSYCAVCDGFFYQGKAVCVIGAGNYALSEATYLTKFTGNVTILTNGENLAQPAPSGVSVINDKISEITGKEISSPLAPDRKTLSVDKIVFENGDTHPADGIFVALGAASSSDFALKLGILMKNDIIQCDQTGATNLPGVFAAGDSIGGIAQVATAVGEGCAAGTSAIAYLKKSAKK